MTFCSTEHLVVFSRNIFTYYGCGFPIKMKLRTFTVAESSCLDKIAATNTFMSIAAKLATLACLITGGIDFRLDLDWSHVLQPVVFGFFAEF